MTVDLLFEYEEFSRELNEEFRVNQALKEMYVHISKGRGNTTATAENQGNTEGCVHQDVYA